MAHWKLFLTNPFRPNRQTWDLHAKKHKGTWMPRAKDRRVVPSTEDGSGPIQERSWEKERPRSPENRHGWNLSWTSCSALRSHARKKTSVPTHLSICLLPSPSSGLETGEQGRGGIYLGLNQAAPITKHECCYKFDLGWGWEWRSFLESLSGWSYIIKEAKSCLLWEGSPKARVEGITSSFVHFVQISIISFSWFFFFWPLFDSRMRTLSHLSLSPAHSIMKLNKTVHR